MALLRPKFRGGNMAVRSSVARPSDKTVDYSDLIVANKKVSSDKLSKALNKNKLQQASTLASNQQIYRNI